MSSSIGRIFRVLIFFFPFRSVREAFPFYLFGSSSRVFWTVSPQARRWRKKRMLPRQRCPFCRHRWFHPHSRLKERQKTCGRAECRREQKRRFNQKWQNEHPDYFRGTYALQTEKYATRAEEKRL
jgi:hypothetical protein